MHRVLWAVVAATALVNLGCEEPLTSPPSTSPSSAATASAISSSGPASAEDAALRKAENAAMALGKKLKGELKGSLDKGDHAAAVKVCSERAPEVGASVREQTGVNVGRSSLRLRNEKNHAPAWVQGWLDEMGERKAADAKPVREIAKGPDGPMARIIKPLEVEAVCVLCHGDASGMSKELSAEIAKRYPKDKATGYAPGDLRGALWAEVAVK